MTRSALIVDDSATMRQMVAYTLKRAGFEVSEALDGQVGLERLDTQRFDLIITDLNMPRVDGITFIRRLRTQSASRHTPVLILTTESQEEKRKEGRAAGASGWIVKPFHPDKLLQVIAKLLP